MCGMFSCYVSHEIFMWSFYTWVKAWMLVKMHRLMASSDFSLIVLLVLFCIIHSQKEYKIDVTQCQKSNSTIDYI